MGESFQVKFLALVFILFSVYSLIGSSVAQASHSATSVFVIRLKPNQDLRAELLSFIRTNKLKAAFIMTCVGSLKKASIRLANTSDVKVFDEFLEIVSLVGLLGESNEHHLHISIADKTGAVWGGHVYGEMIVYTTAEIVIGECTDLTFKREPDPTFGWNELVVYNRTSN